MNDTDETMATDLEPLLLELGKAVYICQAFESTLCLLHAMMSHEDAGGQEETFTASWDFYSVKTLGQTINALRKRIDIPPNLNVYLEKGIKCRNQIVHGYMTKNIARLMEFKGRLEVQKELEALKLEVKRRDIKMNKLLDVYFAKYGIPTKNLSVKQANCMQRNTTPALVVLTELTTKPAVVIFTGHFGMIVRRYARE